MKPNISLLLGLTLISFISQGQGLLNKLKNKASQELNKLDKGTTSTTQPNKNKLSANVTRNVAFTLRDSEGFDYQENCIDLGTSINQISFIVTSNSGNATQCFAYKNGNRTPVPCPTGGNSGCQTSLQCSYTELRELSPMEEEIKKYVTNEADSHDMQTPQLTEQQLKTMQAYMTPAQIEEVKKGMAEAQKQTAGKTYSTVKSSTITFNGKKYGPYKQLGKFYLTPDAKNFYAIVGESGANSAQVHSKMITSASTITLSLGDTDMTMSCFASPDNTDFGFISYGMSAQKYVITTASKKQYELPMAGGAPSTWFSATGNHLIYTTQSDLYFDGQVIKTFPAGSYFKPCDLFVSADGKGVTTIKGNTISFADGDYFEYPLKISIVNTGGKAYYKWLALENREVVVYEKPY